VRDRDDDRTFSAADVKREAGLSYRQVNDWGRKGALTASRDSDRGWRRFTPSELFVILVCAEIRRTFGVPLESLKWLRANLLDHEFDAFRYSAQQMEHSRLPVLLITDLKTSITIENTLEIADRLHHMWFSGVDEEIGTTGQILLKVNPLVNRVLGALKTPTSIPESDRGYALFFASQPTPAELEILLILRQGKFRKIELMTAGGEVTRVIGYEEFVGLTNDEIKELWTSSPHNTVSVTTSDGKVRRVNRELSILLKMAAPNFHRETPAEVLGKNK